MTMPEMEFVESTNINRVGYDANSRDLYIEFVGGSIYAYAEVPDVVFTELMAAPSKGSYLNRVVKDAFQYRKVI